jgi:hypothetical protein
VTMPGRVSADRESTTCPAGAPHEAQNAPPGTS